MSKPQSCPTKKRTRQQTASSYVTSPPVKPSESEEDAPVADKAEGAAQTSEPAVKVFAMAGERSL